MRASFVVSMLFAVLFLPVGSAGAESYSVEPWQDCPASEGDYYNSGNTDAAGNMYIACGSSGIRAYDSTGKRLADIPNPLGAIYDVAASPSGASLYVARGSSPPARLIRSGTSFVWDQAWQPSPYPYPDSGLAGDVSTPLGRFIATDGSGSVYVSDGAWTDHTAFENSWNLTHIRVVKYGAYGTYLTQFGRRLDNSWTLGDFSPGLDGLDVSDDGSRVFVTDANNNRVQFFDRQSGGQYLPAGSLGSTEATDPDRAGSCGVSTAFASPYDVSIDSSANIYVLNTTCREVLKFDPSGSNLLSVTGWTNEYPAHGFVVSANGNRIYVQGPGLLLRRDGSIEDQGASEPSQACLNARSRLIKTNRSIKQTRKVLARTKKFKVRKRLKKKLRNLQKTRSATNRTIRTQCP